MPFTYVCGPEEKNEKIDSPSKAGPGYNRGLSGRTEARCALTRHFQDTSMTELAILKMLQDFGPRILHNDNQKRR